MNKRLKEIKLARHFGFCMGVKRAIKIAEETGGNEKGSVNVINEIVHNDSVVERLARDGIGTVPSVADAESGTVIVSAHGAPPVWFGDARKKGLKIIDATCPLVIRIHKIIHNLVNNGFNIIHYGDSHHDETTGVVGQAAPDRVIVIRDIEELRKIPSNGQKLAITSQTTAGLSDFDKICKEARKLFPGIEVFNTICNATNQRQAAVMDLAPEVELMLVVGSESSANSKRLQSISAALCGKAYLINSVEDLNKEWLDQVETVGLTAGASTPDFLVDDVIAKLISYSGGGAKVMRPPRKKRSRAKTETSPDLER